MAEITSLGAAIAAGNAVGAWSLQKNEGGEINNVEEELSRENGAGRKSSTIFRPEMKEEIRAEKYGTWKKAVKMSFGWL